MPIKKGDKVKVEYEGTLEDGTVFDSSEKHGQPLEFEMGSGQIIPGFEKAIAGMKKGQEKNITLKPSDAYGDPKPELIKTIPKTAIPTDKELKPGMLIGVGLPNGAQLPAKITKVTKDLITIDLNHPLAGKVLNFKVKVVSIA